MINNYPAFQPSLQAGGYPGPAGLRIWVGPQTTSIAGTVSVSNVLFVVPSQYVNVAPLSITYVFLDLTTATIQSNTTGFSSTVYPIAIVTTSQTSVTSLQDVRADLLVVNTGGGGGGGSSTDTILAIAAPGNIPFVVGENLFATVVAAANPQALPSAVGVGGQTIKILKSDSSGTVNVTGATGGTYFLTQQYQFVLFESNNVAWFVIGGN